MSGNRRTGIIFKWTPLEGKRSIGGRHQRWEDDTRELAETLVRISVLFNCSHIREFLPYYYTVNFERFYTLCFIPPLTFFVCSKLHVQCVRMLFNDTDCTSKLLIGGREQTMTKEPEKPAFLSDTLSIVCPASSSQTLQFSNTSSRLTATRSLFTLFWSNQHMPL